MRITRKRSTYLASVFFVLLLAVTLGVSLVDRGAEAQSQQLDPAEVREAAIKNGLDSLRNVIVNDPGGLTDFVRPGAGPSGIDPVARQALIQLGKALFWDRQVGSDGQACGSCHFVAFADPRTKNQLSPALRNTDPQERVTFDLTLTGGKGPNLDVTAADFPFHQMEDPLEENYLAREVTFDLDDVMSSQGVFGAQFAGVPPPDVMTDLATPIVDPDGFQIAIAGLPRNVRRVEPRNTPSNVNALFNFHNFWDGRANFAFNGVDVIGPLSTLPFIWSNTGGELVQVPTGAGAITQGSLASQAVGPPVNTEEMSFFGRTFKDVGRKLLQGPTVYSSYPYAVLPNTVDPMQTRRPLQFQEVHDNDSHLRIPLNGQPLDRGGAGVPGLELTYPTPVIPTSFPPGTPSQMPMYQALIQIAFQDRWWNAPETGAIDPVLGVPQQQRINGYTLMEQNFSLFFGIAVQMYETELRADQSPFDRFMEGDDTFGTVGEGAQFGMTDEELLQARLRGLLIFAKTDLFFQQSDPTFNGIRDSNCTFCHGGPELSNASLAGAGETEFEIEVQSIRGRFVEELNHTGLEEDAFNNIGVRPTREDLARGGFENNFTLSGLQANLEGTPGAVLPPRAVVAPNPFRILDDGAFKVPLLRNVELTAPYFHNGGQLTLAQVVQFYMRTGDFADVNVKDIEPNLAGDLILLEESDTPFLVHFLLSLTDERVRFDRAPFDHPQIQVPNGHTGLDIQELTPGVFVAEDDLLDISAVGAEGRVTPLPTFLNISRTPVPGENNDHFDVQPAVEP